MAADGISMPEPDIAVVEPGDPQLIPTAALLVIEIAKSSFKIDTTVKPSHLRVDAACPTTGSSTSPGNA